MKVYGAGYNLALFEKYALVILEEARLDHEKALPNVEVFLGEVFRKDSLQPKQGEMFLPDADECRREYGAKAGVMLAQSFLDLLAIMVRKQYLPETSPRWVELEKLIGRSPMKEAVEGLFTAALLGQTQPADQRPRGKNSIPNYHSWRRWFYSLWGQHYEWGRFTINERTAEANGELYQFTIPPSHEGENTMIQPKQLLEAHGFKVVVHPGHILEYWR